MTGNTVNGGENGARSGAQTLVLLSSPSNIRILHALAEGPQRQIDLRRAAGSPAQSTMRAHLRELERIGAIAKRRRNAFPGAHEYELERPGRELMFVVRSLERWLAAAPNGPMALGGEAAKSAIKALVEGWSSTVLRALAAGPLSLTELDRIIGHINYPSLERRLGAMRLAGQVEPLPGNGRGMPYGATDWSRLGVAPIVAASRWERHNMAAETAPIGRVDIEAAFLLAVPLLRLPIASSGSCRLALKLNKGSREQMGGVMVTIEEGRAVSCTTHIEGAAGAWANGSAAAWFRAVIEADPDHLEIGGDGRLGRALVNSLYDALFGAGARWSSQRI